MVFIYANQHRLNGYRAIGLVIPVQPVAEVANNNDQLNNLIHNNFKKKSIKDGRVNNNNCMVITKR